MDALAAHLARHGHEPVRVDRNLAVVKDSGVPGPTLLLCSHTDTVAATPAWTRDPWAPTLEDGRLYGLGANDAKASVAAMAEAFLAAAPQIGRLVFAPVCEEEIGRGGLEAFLPHLPVPDMAIIGEPTGLDLATAQNGMLILDCVARGRAGHAARPQLADNALYKAARDILALEDLALTGLQRVHPLAGRTTLAVTVCAAGDRHNVIPGQASFTVDLRTTPDYTHDELVELVQHTIASEVKVRSDRFRPVATPEHTRAGARLLGAAQRALTDAGRTPRVFHSPTLSDWAHLGHVAGVKWGPGLSEVSHTADEWVEVQMVEDAARLYLAVVDDLLGGA